VLFGGVVGNPGFETWEWNGTAWQLVDDINDLNAPTPRTDASMVFDGMRVLMYGGRDSSELHAWNRTAWSLPPTANAPVRNDFGMSFDLTRQRLVVFGGGGASATTFEWDGATFTDRTPGLPPPRSQHTMVYDEARGRIVMFGGGIGNLFGDTWQ